MKLIELTELDKDNYNHFVASQPSGSFLQSWEWGQWQEALGREVFRFQIKDDSEKQIGSIQLIKSSLFGNKYYLYAPYGPVIGENFKFQISNFKLELRERFSDAMFVRVEPQSQLISLSGSQQIRKSVNIQPAVTIVVDINKTDEELLAAMHPKTRYNIKIAERHGVVVEHELAVTPAYGLYVQQAVELIVQTQERQKYRGHSASYYYDLIDFFALHNTASDLKIHIYKALFEKELIVSAIMVDFGTTRMYLYGGSSENNKNTMAPYLLHWQAIKDARNLGITNYDLGGSEVASGGERGFTRFKRGFGGQVVEYGGAYDIIWKKLWYTIYYLGRKLHRLLK